MNPNIRTLCEAIEVAIATEKTPESLYYELLGNPPELHDDKMKKAFDATVQLFVQQQILTRLLNETVPWSAKITLRKFKKALPLMQRKKESSHYGQIFLRQILVFISSDILLSTTLPFHNQTF